MCFERDANIPLDKAAFIYARVGEIIRARARSVLCGSNRKRGREEVFVRWMHPQLARGGSN